VSLDSDSLDTSFAPGTAGLSAGGRTTREVAQIVIGGLKCLNIVGVEVMEILTAINSSPTTAITAADLTFEMRSILNLIMGKNYLHSLS